jgi:hypothetical protein
VTDNESLLIQRTREKLDEGFHVYNLYDVVKLLRQMSASTRWPTACFVLLTVARDIIYDWDKQPVPSVEADSVGAQLQPLFCRVLDLMAQDADVQQMSAALDDLVLVVTKLRG